MSNTKIRELESVVAKLETERQQHLQAVAEIDAAFEKMGISPSGQMRRKPGPKPGKRKGKLGAMAYKKPGPKPKGKSARKGKGPTGNRYAVSGTELVLGMVKKAGAKGVPGGEINEIWVKQGRAGSAYNILGQLLDANKVKKQKNKAGRGSLYIAA